MKTRILLLSTLLCALVALPGCLRDKCERVHEYVRYDPVYLTSEGMRVDVKAGAARELNNPGNIYFYNGFILINEILQGVHVIDNSNPSNPVNVAFIEIPGCRDMAIRNNVLYADMFIDLVAVDITDVRNPVLLCRVDNVFQNFFANAGALGYIVEYIPTDEVVRIECNDDRWGSWWWRSGPELFLQADVSMTFNNTSSFAGSSSAGAPSGTGIGGSMARFTLAKDHLYTLDSWRMHVFGLASTCPDQKSTIEVGGGIETLFPYNDYLFIGSRSGMIIYDNFNPEQPVYRSQFQHAQACDPVFVSEDIAYVTLRDGTTCQNFINQLDVIDVSNINNPRLIRTYPMQHPHGLSVVENTLYLCEGRFGLKVFDVENKNTVSGNLLGRIENLHAFDVIVLPQSSLAMVIGEKGLYQYDASDRTKLVELSMIPVNRR